MAPHPEIKKFWENRGGKFVTFDHLRFVDYDEPNGNSIFCIWRFVPSKNEIIYRFERFGEEYNEKEALRIIRMWAFL